MWKVIPRSSVAALAFALSIPFCEQSVSAQCNLNLTQTGNFITGRETRSIATGDFNGDGITDMASANVGGQDVAVFLGLSDGDLRRSKPLMGEDFRTP